MRHHGTYAYMATCTDAHTLCACMCRLWPSTHIRTLYACTDAYRLCWHARGILLRGPRSHAYTYTHLYVYRCALACILMLPTPIWASQHLCLPSYMYYAHTMCIYVQAPFCGPPRTYVHCMHGYCCTGTTQAQAVHACSGHPPAWAALARLHLYIHVYMPYDMHPYAASGLHL